MEADARSHQSESPLRVTSSPPLPPPCRHSNCSYELLGVQRALRMRLYTPPGKGALSGGLEDEKAPYSAGSLGGRRADACLLLGYLVETRVPGWVETRAAMSPPPAHLLEAAQAPVTKGSDGSMSRYVSQRSTTWDGAAQRSAVQHSTAHLKTLCCFVWCSQRGVRSAHLFTTRQGSLGERGCRGEFRSRAPWRVR